MFRFGDPGGRAYASSSFMYPAWWTSSANSNLSSPPTVQAGYGRLVGSAIRFGNAYGGQWNSLTKQLPDSQPTLGAAFAFKCESGLPDVAITIASFVDSSTAQCDIRLGPLGQLIATRNGTVLGSTSNGLVVSSTWVHVEFLVTFNSSAGTVYIGVNGASALSLTGQNTQNSGNAYASVLTIGVGSGAGTTVSFQYDDIILYDAQADDANGFPDLVGPIGDCALSWIQPSANGTTTQFTPLSGSNYAEVDIATPTGDSSYVASQTVGNIDTYAMTALPTGVTIVREVIAVHYARLDGTDPRSIASELRSAGANAQNAGNQSLTSTYAYYLSNWGKNPNNGSPIAWTVAAVNALEAGQIVSV